MPNATASEKLLHYTNLEEIYVRISHLLASGAIFVLPFFAHADSICDDGSLVNLSGRLTTINTSPTRQAGQICVTLTGANGKDVFDQCGAILGTVLSSDPATGRSTLSHTTVFNNTHAFTTKSDLAQITGVLAVDAAGVPCAFNVTEKITQISWATGILKTGSADITAVGSVSACPTKNLNSFTLSGKVCIREMDD